MHILMLDTSPTRPLTDGAFSPGAIALAAESKATTAGEHRLLVQVGTGCDSGGHGLQAQVGVGCEFRWVDTA